MEKFILILCLIKLAFDYNVNAQLVDCLESDREALVDFQNGLVDHENHLSSWTGRNCCQWQGIGCEISSGAVIAVELRNLRGEIRPSLAKLKSLSHLDLSSNSFNSIPIPEFLGSLQKLQYLNLSSSGFSGAVPPNLGNLSSLQYLDVSLQFLTVQNIEWVTGLISLKHLAMDEVDLSKAAPGWLEAFNKLPFLTELHLSSCSLSRPIPTLTFLNFTSLAVIDLSLNHFHSKIPYWLVNTSSLVDVHIRFSSLHGRIPLGFSELPNLLSLDLAENFLKGDCSQLFQGSWRKIEVLDLFANLMSGKIPPSIGNMTSLAYFNLQQNRIKGGIPSSIGKLCNLKCFDLFSNKLSGSLPQDLEGTENCLSKSPLPSLQNLVLSSNQMVGNLPEWLGKLESLVELRLDHNLLQGPIPASFESLQSLSTLELQSNKLNGTLPDSLGQLSELYTFDVSSNHLTGILSEVHFTKLSMLKIIELSFNSFILNVSDNWVPPFQVGFLAMGSCHLGPSFPTWLRSQKEVQILDFSNGSISDSLPDWFWKLSSNLFVLNVSLNQLKGWLPNPLNVAHLAGVDFSSNLLEGPIPLPGTDIQILDLSNNQFSGPIPKMIGYSMPQAGFLSLSGNQLIGEIPDSIGEMFSLQVIDLSRNHLTGSIPSNLHNLVNLKVLDLKSNNLLGEIPDSLGQLSMLQSLHLSDNNLSGEVPSSFQNLSSLETLDLGNNELTGGFPQWIGAGFPNLRILCLRSNAFSGQLPPTLSNLTSLQVLDLAENMLTGIIPASFGDLKAMTEDKNLSNLHYGIL